MFRFILGLPFSLRQKRLAAARPKIDKEQFISLITKEGADKKTAGTIWEVLIADRIDENFAPYPDDSLGRVYGIAEEELDQDLIVRVLKELNIPIPDHDYTQRFGVIDSPRRVAEFVDDCRRRASGLT